MKKKLIIFEPKIITPKGHHIDSLLNFTKELKNKFEIQLILNKKFEGKEINKSKIKFKKIISSSNDKKNGKIIYFINELFLTLKNIYYTFYFFVKFKNRKKKKKYINLLIQNFFIIPKYFVDYYFYLEKINLNKNDNIYIRNCRNQDIATIFFLINLLDQIPKFHLQFHFAPKRKFKDIFFYLNKILKIKDAKNKIFYYTEHENLNKKFNINLKNNINLNTIYQPTRFHKRFNNTKKKNIGFLGEVRKDKRYDKVIDYIIKINNNKNFKNINFIVLISSSLKNATADIINLIKLQKKYNNVHVIKKYLKNDEYYKLLKKINLMPIMHTTDQLNNFGSGLIYNCLSYEIPFICPKKCKIFNKISNFKKFKTKYDTKYYIKKTSDVLKNYQNYLSYSKKYSKNLNDKIKKNSLIKNFNLVC